jgi:hypothetical protein
MPVSPKNRPRKKAPAPPPPPDEPWCGEFGEHDCLGSECPRRPVGRNLGYGGEPSVGDDVVELPAEQQPRRPRRVDTLRTPMPPQDVITAPAATFVSVGIG